MKAISNVISSASGSLGGATFRSTRHGMVISGKATPRQRSVAKDSSFFGPGLLPTMPDMRQHVSAASRAWGHMTQAHRDSYKYLPAGFKTDFEYYLYISYSRLLIGGPLREAAPAAKVPNWYPFLGERVTEEDLGIESDFPPGATTLPWIYALCSQNFAAPAVYIPPLYYVQAYMSHDFGVYIANPTGYQRLRGEVVREDNFFYVKVYQIESTSLMRRLEYQGWYRMDY